MERSNIQSAVAFQCYISTLTGYWESLLQQLKAHVAKTRLRERHQEVLRRKLFKLKQEVSYNKTSVSLHVPYYG